MCSPASLLFYVSTSSVYKIKYLHYYFLFSFVSLWFSGIGSALALIVAQYSAFKIQHEHSLTLSQR